VNTGAKFIATNEDAYDVLEGGKHMPGTGTTVAAIEYGSEATAIIAGKPNHYVLDVLEKEHTVIIEKTIMIGDRCDTDVMTGINGGISSCLVLSGVVNETNLEKHLAKLGGKKPTYIATSIAFWVINAWLYFIIFINIVENNFIEHVDLEF